MQLRAGADTLIAAYRLFAHNAAGAIAGRFVLRMSVHFWLMADVM